MNTQETAPRITHSARRINKVRELLGGETYLEVGVFKGLTFGQVAYERRVAVDPNPRFDPSEPPFDTAEVNAMTSDAYFASTEIAKPIFDFMFLDGLHEFKQTFRDFCASQALAHDRTVWLIDDVVPNDVYSAWPQQMRAIELRERFGGTNRSWHGDVFRTALMIDQYFPSFRYEIVTGSGNPQLFAWKAPRAGFADRGLSLVQIENFHYFDMLADPIFTKRAKEDEVIAQIAEDLARP